MDKFSDQKRAVQYLYPPIDPFDQRMMDVVTQSILNNAATPKVFPSSCFMVVREGGAARQCAVISTPKYTM